MNIIKKLIYDVLHFHSLIQMVSSEKLILFVEFDNILLSDLQENSYIYAYYIVFMSY